MIYQIFPDRFAIGKPNNMKTKLAHPVYQRPEYTLHTSWEEAPRGGNDFFGGDLQGIVDNLDYVQDLGATALYLTPIFSAHSNHKYNTADFSTVDPMFGSEQVVKNLIDALHSRGMRLIMDAVFNHVGKDSVWFQAALRNERPYRDFFTFLPGGGYLCWWGIDTLAELRLENPILQRLLFRDRDSVLQRWLDLGLDEWRFDAAIDLGLNVTADIRRDIAERFPQARLTGEVLSFGADFCATNLYFHGVMNYWFRYSVLGWLDGSIKTPALNRAISDYYERYGHEGALSSWNILSTHDTPRLRSVMPNDAERRLALVLQFTLPGEPLVYYGEENGMQGGEDPDNRRPMCWDRAAWNQGIRAFYRKLIAIRGERRELREGRLVLLGEYLDDDADALAYLRYTEVPSEEALIVVNHDTKPLKQRLLIPHTHFYPTLHFKNLLAPDTQPIQFRYASFPLDVPAKTATIYVPDDSQPNYAFFKPRHRRPGNDLASRAYFKSPSLDGVDSLQRPNMSRWDWVYPVWDTNS